MKLGDHKVYIRHHFTVIETVDMKKSHCKQCKGFLFETSIHWAADKLTSKYKRSLRFCSDDCIDTWEFAWLEKRAVHGHPWQYGGV